MVASTSRRGSPAGEDGDEVKITGDLSSIEDPGDEVHLLHLESRSNGIGGGFSPVGRFSVRTGERRLEGTQPIVAMMIKTAKD